MKIKYIGAIWCKYCREVKPKIYLMQGHHDVDILEITQENKQEIKDKYLISCIPALIIYDDDDNELSRWDADMDEKFDDFLLRNRL